MPEANEVVEIEAWWARALIGRNPRRTLVRIVIWVVLLLLVHKFALLPIRVVGVSMLPNYRDKTVNVVNRLAYVFHEPRRGDVVAIRMAGEHAMYLKRVVGLPGEKVGFHLGRAVVNGQPLDEPWLRLPCNWEAAPVEVGPYELFVVGDNRSMPIEDHRFGRTERKRVVGKPLL